MSFIKVNSNININIIRRKQKYEQSTCTHGLTEQPYECLIFFFKLMIDHHRLNDYFCTMAENYRRPTNSNGPIPFSFEAEGQIFSGTLTPSGKLPAFGMPNTFILRTAGKPTMTISIYMGKWIIQGSSAFAQALSEWINNYYR